MTTLWSCEQLETVCLLSLIGHNYQTQLVTVKHGQRTVKPYGTSRQHGQQATMKTLVIVAGLAIALMFVVTSCSDRIRGECTTKPEAPRCDTSTGATTP
jgi:hypothetical protein